MVIDVVEAVEKDQPPNVVKNPDGSYMNQEQIIEHLKESITDEETINVIANDFQAPADADIATKFAYLMGASSFGMFVRNRYGLWRPDNPYTVLNPAPNNGIIDHPQFPDNYSEVIVKEIVKYFQEKKGVKTPDTPVVEIYQNGGKINDVTLP